MNARPEHALEGRETANQGTHTDTRGDRDEESDRGYTCLDCGRQLDSFPLTCPGCGGRQFQTEVPAVSEPARLPGYDIFEATLARFNPYIPR